MTDIVFCRVLVEIIVFINTNSKRSTMPGLRLFFDAFSPPSRAVAMLLIANKIPHERAVVNIAKRESNSRHGR